MSSFVYFYSKFTDEFLLLTAGAIFALLAMYCYHWAVKRRRLGTAGELIPAGIVRAYLNQMIGETQQVRTQLFGILGNTEPPNVSGKVDAMLSNMMGNTQSGSNDSLAADSVNAALAGNGQNGAISPELLKRLQSLETQLAEKEGMIVNVNIEKNKLLQDLEGLKKNTKSLTPAAAAPGNEDLLKRLKTLEQQLEEYNMFEDDLANIKRIQQENDQLKKKIEEFTLAGAMKQGGNKVADDDFSIPTATTRADGSGPSLDQASINALLEGESPVPPVDAAELAAKAVTNEPQVAPPAATEAVSVSPAKDKTIGEDVTTVASIASTIAPAEPAAPAQSTGPAISLVPPIADQAADSVDDFEKLANSVDKSLSAPTAAEPQAAVAQAAPAQAAPAPAAEAMQSKSDEELLKEFENLLNSG